MHMKYLMGIQVSIHLSSTAHELSGSWIKIRGEISDEMLLCRSADLLSSLDFSLKIVFWGPYSSCLVCDWSKFNLLYTILFPEPSQEYSLSTELGVSPEHRWVWPPTKKITLGIWDHTWWCYGSPRVTQCSGTVQAHGSKSGCLLCIFSVLSSLSAVSSLPFRPPVSLQ